MFSHVMLGANDLEKSKVFYDAILGVLGYGPGVLDAKGRYLYLSDGGIFIITKPINGEAAFHGNGMTTGFAASSPELVEAWHAAGVAAGGVSCEEPPGVRAGGDKKIYLAYLRDPSDNKICTAHFMS
nr:VOC family protein [uncultured Amphritea sp.]